MLFHHFLSTVLVATTLEFILTYIEFDIYNAEGQRNSFLLVMNVLLSSLRNTVARILILIIALGYGITVSHLSKYHMQLAFLGFAYFIAHTIFMTL